MTNVIIDIQPKTLSSDDNIIDTLSSDDNIIDIDGHLMSGRYTITEPGKVSPYYDNNQDYLKRSIGRYIWLCLCYPMNFLLFVVIYIGQLCSPCCLSICGNKWCYNPSQHPYTHTLFIIRNTIIGWKNRFCCCISEKVAVLLYTWPIPSPPLYIFNEKVDNPELLDFKRYVNEMDNIPKYSGQYRSIDGGGNRKDYPFLGQGGRGYAQTEPFQVIQIKPNIEDMITRLYKRKSFIPAINGINSVATWLANVAIHDLFRSANNIKRYGMDKPWVNMNSSYLDLQVLYGYNEKTMKDTRSYKDGKLVKIAEDRMDKIPESRAIIELFLREHNYVCDRLKELYPFNFFTDEHVYQQARLIMGGVFINIIFRDYLGCIMFSENAEDGKPFIEFRQKYPGTRYGNHNSLNFNILYQWHSTIPLEWDPKNIPKIDNDEDLRSVFTNMLKWRSGAHRPHNTPDFLKRATKSLIETARKCGTPRLNDFRRRFTLPYKDFMDMCDDEEISNILSSFYPTIEDVELVVGVQVEKSSNVGWGLPNTVEKSIISDAFCTVLNDRFYTDDYNPKIYTHWGFNHTKTTNLADLLNRHLEMGIDRNIPLEKLAGWTPPTF